MKFYDRDTDAKVNASVLMLKQSLENQGIDNDIIESAYVLYHNWEPQERKQ